MAHHQRQNELETQIRILEGALAQARREIAELEHERIEYASILANVPLFIIIVDEHRRVRKVSHAVLHTLGRVEEELLGMRGGEALRCVHHLDDPQGCGFGPACETCTIRILVQDTLTHGKSHHRVEARLSTIDDALAERILRVSTTLIQNGGVKKAHIFVEDVTEQKQAEKLLHVRERQQRAISQISQMALTKADVSSLLDKGTELLQQTLEIDLTKILELQPDENCFLLRAGRGWHDGLVGKARVGAGKESQAGFTLLSSQAVIVTDLHTESRFSGPSLLVDHGVTSGISVIIGHIDKPYGVLGVHSTTYREFSQHDIDFVQSMADVLATAIERRKMEVVLRESEERYRLLFHQSPLGVLHVDKKGVIVDINENYARMIGATREDAIGVDILGKATDPDVIRAIDDALNGKIGYFAGELRSAISGRTIVCKVTGQGIRDEHGALIGGIAIVEDLTEQKKLQESLRKSEFYLRQAQSVAGVGSWHLDIYHDILTWSEQAYRIFGMETHTLLNMSSFLDRVHPEDRPAVKAAWLAALKGAPYNIEHRIIISGETHWVHEKAQITFDHNGSALEGIGTVHDITERKKAEEKIKRASEEWEQTFNSVPDLIAILDNQFRIVRANKAMADKLGITPAEAVGNTCYECVHAQHEPSPDCPQKQLLADGKGHTAEVFEERLGGDFLVSVSPLFNSADQLIGSVHTARDISERKRTEEALQHAKEAAESANKAKSAFLANMSHELRSPLNAIIGFAQLITRNSALPHEEQENLAIIQQSGEHLLTLINQVLDFSKIEAGRITLNEQTFDLYSLLDEMNAMFSLRARQRGLNLACDLSANVPQYVRTDAVKLRQVLINLLSNAIKFTEEGDITLEVTKVPGVPKVEAFPSLKGPGVGAQSEICTLQFHIQDTGVGIAPEEKEALFEAFAQTESGRKLQEGTGLGLPISRKFVQLMGGDITVKSDVERGTVFTFDIRVELVNQPATGNRLLTPSKRAIALAAGQPCYRLLVVDDKPDNRILLRKLLSRFDFELREAANGQEAIGMWKEWEPHLIWMDVRMPGMGGYEAAQQIRAQVNGAAPVIIALSTSSAVDELKSALSRGCDDFLRKPFREADIFDMLEKHLEVRFVYDDSCEMLSLQEEQHALHKLSFALSALPSDLMSQLEQAVTISDVKRIQHAITAIHSCNMPLAATLTELAENFEYSGILTAIQESRTSPLTPQVLAQLPKTWYTLLEQAIETADASAAEEVSAKIRLRHPRLAEALTALVKQYRFKHLQELFMQAEHLGTREAAGRLEKKGQHDNVSSQSGTEERQGSQE